MNTEGYRYDPHSVQWEIKKTGKNIDGLLSEIEGLSHGDIENSLSAPFAENRLIGRTNFTTPDGRSFDVYIDVDEGSEQLTEVYNDASQEGSHIYLIRQITYTRQNSLSQYIERRRRDLGTMEAFGERINESPIFPTGFGDPFLEIDRDRRSLVGRTETLAGEKKIARLRVNTGRGTAFVSVSDRESDSIKVSLLANPTYPEIFSYGSETEILSPDICHVETEYDGETGALNEIKITFTPDNKFSQDSTDTNTSLWTLINQTEHIGLAEKLGIGLLADIFACHSKDDETKATKLIDSALSNLLQSSEVSYLQEQLKERLVHAGFYDFVAEQIARGVSFDDSLTLGAAAQTWAVFISSISSLVSASYRMIRVIQDPDRLEGYIASAYTIKNDSRYGQQVVPTGEQAKLIDDGGALATDDGYRVDITRQDDRQWRIVSTDQSGDRKLAIIETMINAQKLRATLLDPDQSMTRLKAAFKLLQLRE